MIWFNSKGGVSPLLFLQETDGIYVPHITDLCVSFFLFVLRLIKINLHKSILSRAHVQSRSNPFEFMCDKSTVHIAYHTRLLKHHTKPSKFNRSKIRIANGAKTNWLEIHIMCVTLNDYVVLLLQTHQRLVIETAWKCLSTWLGYSITNKEVQNEQTSSVSIPYRTYQIKRHSVNSPALFRLLLFFVLFPPIRVCTEYWRALTHAFIALTSSAQIFRFGQPKMCVYGKKDHYCVSIIRLNIICFHSMSSTFFFRPFHQNMIWFVRDIWV